jgi:hypothetical protein
MASFLQTANLDSLTVGNIYTRNINKNSNIPAYNVLSADGLGGTMWITLSTIAFKGGAFRSIRTSQNTYSSDISAATFSLLDGPNVSLFNDPTAPNTARIYAKAFGQFDISGGNSLTSYNPETGSVTSNVLFVGTGGIKIKGDPQKNILFFDGRELPFVSTLPYSFSQFLVYSNAPLNTLEPSTFSSIIIQAQGPSSLLSFVGEDLLRIQTDYSRNSITFRLSTLTTGFVSSLLDRQQFLLSTSVQKVELSTFSTTYGQLISFQNLQANLCTMSTTLLTLINRNSTNIADVKVYSRGISSVWRTYLVDRYTLTYNTEAQIQSTSYSFTSSITDINDYLNDGYNTLKGSTIQTPLFWTSTLVTPIATIDSPIVSPPAVSATLYPTYDSLYNVFGDTQPFGSPIQPTIYPASIDVTTNRAISTISTTTASLFSSMFTLTGSFAILPNDDSHHIQIDYSGNLSFKINGTNYSTVTSIAYPRLETFEQRTIAMTIPGGSVYRMSFIYIKQNPSDYITFSNMNDYIYGTDTFSIAPIYPAYGYNTSETPLLSQQITNFPIGFSTFSNVGSYLQLSTYMIVASSFYTTGCNTMFPISSMGFQSFSFKETTSGKSATAFAQNLSLNTSGQVSSIFSASNAFQYSFTSQIPDSSYSLQFVYGKQQQNESLFLSTPFIQHKTYDYAYATYISTLIYASTLSTFNGFFVNLNVKNLNATDLIISTLYTSSMSSIQGNFLNINVSSINNSNIANIGGANSASTFSTLTTYLNTINSTINVNLSTFSTIPLVPALVTYLNQVNSTINVNLSTFSTIPLVPALVTYLNQVNSTINVNLSTFSTIPLVPALVTYLNQVNSSINVNLCSFSTVPVFQNLATYINQVNSTINVNISSFSTVPVFQNLATYINQVNSTINVNLSTFSSARTFPASSDSSTISTIFTSIFLLASSLTGNTSNLSTTWTPPGELYTSTLYTSSISLGGYRQPFIQYGFNTITNPGTPIPLSTSYINTYAIQLSYSNSTQPISSLFSSNVHPSSFYVMGDIGKQFYWTTFGSIN